MHKKSAAPIPRADGQVFAVAAALALVAGASALTAEAHLAEIAKLYRGTASGCQERSCRGHWSQEPDPSAQPHSAYAPFTPSRQIVPFAPRYQLGDGDVVQFDELQKTDQTLGLLIQTAVATGVVRAPCYTPTPTASAIMRRGRGAAARV